MENQHENIIIIASRLFDEFGIRSVSIDNMCSELRISKKTFYTYFLQKEDLVAAVLSYQKKANYAKFEKLLKNKNAIDSLIIIIKEIKRLLETESHRMCRDLKKYYPNVYEKYEFQKDEDIRNGFELNLQQGIAEGFYREDLDPELISLFHSILIKSTFVLMEQSQKKYTKKRLVEFFFDLMIHLISNEKGLKYLEEQNLGDTEENMILRK